MDSNINQFQKWRNQNNLIYFKRGVGGGLLESEKLHKNQQKLQNHKKFRPKLKTDQI